MTHHRLPGRIAAVMVGAVAAFLLMLVGLAVWLTQAMDERAQHDSISLVRGAVAGVAATTTSMSMDYGKWEEAVPQVRAGNEAWLSDYIGNSAVAGEAIQLTVIWGGDLRGDLGWIDGGEPGGEAGLLDDRLIASAEAGLRAVPLDAYEGASFFAWSGGQLYAMAVARIEHPDGSGPAEHERGRILMGRRIDAALLREVARDTLMTGMGIGGAAPAGRLSVPLTGADGVPVAHLYWAAPRPGTAALWRAVPILAVVAGLGAGLVLLGTAVARRSAQDLVRAQRQACAAAHTDALTGLPNRAAFNEALAVPAQAGGRAVLFLDVNDFKRINDSIGHEAGDEVIACVARRLAWLAGPGCLLARIAGDEFVFVVEGSGVEDRARALAARAAEVLASPIGALGHQMQVTMSMGYAVQATDGMAGRDLVRQADLAMYEAKRHKGEPRVVAFSAVIGKAAQDALVIEQGLRRALARPGEISIAYQPIVGADGRLVRAEALARWTSPELGPVPPDRFVAVAEQAGLIMELGGQILGLVCDDLVAHPGLEVSVNISTLQLMAPDFIPGLVGALEARGIDPARMEIELTEAVVVDDPRLAAQRLGELRAAGFSIALDDFGTGYSSVGYLEQFRFDTLKIDRSFVSKIRASAKGVRVVDAMIMMAHGLDLHVVCEGVETAEELDLLRDLGADLAQGYFLDRPLPVDALAARWLSAAGDRAVA